MNITLDPDTSFLRPRNLGQLLLASWSYKPYAFSRRAFFALWAIATVIPVFALVAEVLVARGFPAYAFLLRGMPFAGTQIVLVFCGGMVLRSVRHRLRDIGIRPDFWPLAAVPLVGFFALLSFAVWPSRASAAPQT